MYRKIYREAYSAINKIITQNKGFRYTKTCVSILEVINKMEADLDDLIKKKLESFYQLVKEEQASTSVGGHRGSHKFSFIKLHKLQTPNESESQNLQTLVENVKHHYLEVDQRVNFRRNMIFWIGVVLHVTNLVRIQLTIF